MVHFIYVEYTENLKVHILLSDVTVTTMAATER